MIRSMGVETRTRKVCGVTDMINVEGAEAMDKFSCSFSPHTHICVDMYMYIGTLVS